MSIDFDTPGGGDDQPEWLSESMMGDEPGGGDDGNDNNRLFLIIAIGLAGLIVLGLFAVGGLLFIRRARNVQLAAQITPTTQEIVLENVVPSPTFTLTPLPPTATSTPTIAPTNTRVVQEDGLLANGEQAGAGDSGDAGSGGTEGQADATPTPTNTPVVPPPTPIGGATEVPNTGFGGFEAGLIALGLLLVVFVSRRLRRVA